MNYQEYLRSQDWRKLKQEAVEKYGNKCEFCGKDYEAIHHHTYPKRLYWDSIENLVVVCKKCHEKCHGIRDHAFKCVFYKEQDGWYLHDEKMLKESEFPVEGDFIFLPYPDGGYSEWRKVLTVKKGDCDPAWDVGITCTSETFDFDKDVYGYIYWRDGSRYWRPRKPEPVNFDILDSIGKEENSDKDIPFSIIDD